MSKVTSKHTNNCPVDLEACFHKDFKDVFEYVFEQLNQQDEII